MKTAAPTARVLILGNPNVGKSSLFNALTGGRQHIVNAPGTTLEVAERMWASPRGTFDVWDLPGTYSLIALAPDEDVVARAVDEAGGDTVAIVIVDATSPSRSLYLLAQVADRGVPVVAALAMNDLATAHGHRVDPGTLSARIGIPVVEVDPRTHVGLESLADEVGAAIGRRPRLRGLAPGRAVAGGAKAPIGDSRSAEQASAARHFDWVAQVAEDLYVRRPPRRSSDRLDRVLLAPLTGIPIFLAVLWGLFELTTRATAPLITAVTGFVGGPVASGASWLLERVGVGGGWFESLIVDGLLVGVATVAAFVPVLALVFLALGSLEASGYMARVAVVADRAMRVLGLDGRAVLPLMIGFGCNVPALAATKSLPRAKDRLLTALLVPYTSCSARLTVYIVLANTFVPDHAGTAVFALHVLSVVLVVGIGALLGRTVVRGVDRAPLAMILPPYQWPATRILTRSTLSRVGDFITSAGLIIVSALVVLWMAAAIPVKGDHSFGDVPVADSLYGAAARAVAPALEPMGLGDWRIAAALGSGVVAKEVTVATLAQSYAVEDPLTGNPANLAERVRETVAETSGGHPTAAGFAFMVLVLAYTPCLATMLEQRRLLGWRWAALAAGLHLLVAGALATLVFQVGRLL